MVGDDAEKCPACGVPVTGDAWCPACGLEIAGDEAGTLRALADGLAAAEAELEVVWARRDAAAKELSTRQWARTMNARQAPAPPSWHAPPVGPRSSEEWTVDRVRNLLLWAGAALLALSALAFTAVAWTHLGPVGRAALLVVITIVAAIGATASRERLPATSGALTGLTIALALVDWQIVRRAGVAPGLSGTAWWAIGTGAVGVASLAFGQIAARQTAHRAVGVLLPTSAVLAIGARVSSDWGTALSFSLLAVALVAVLQARSHVADPILRALLGFEAGATWIAGAVAAIVSAFWLDTFVETLTPATVFLTLAAAPAIVLAFAAASERRRVTMASLVLATIMSAVLTLASTSIGVIGMLTLAVVLGGIALAAATRCTGAWRPAAQLTGWAAIAPGALYAAPLAAVAEFGPLTWLGHAWTGSTSATATSVVLGPIISPPHDIGWCVVGILVALAVTAAIALRPRSASAPPEQLRPEATVPAALLLVVGAVAPLAAGASVGVACAVAAVMFVVTVLASTAVIGDDADRLPAFSLLALLPAVPAAGWAATTSGASIAVLAAAAVVAAIAGVTARVPALRASYAAQGAAATSGLATVIALAAGTATATAGFTGAAVGGVLLVLGSQLRRDTLDGGALEVTGAIAMIAGTVLASESVVWLAATLTLAVPLLLAASLRGHRSLAYGVAAAVAALGATWAWLAAAEVTVVEAYTLPAAAVALGLGSLARRDGPAHSWLTLGPAVVLALGPTVVLAIGRNDDGRAIAVGLAALVILVAGAYRRLQAPIVLGTAALVVLGIDKFGPIAVRLPRWLMLAFAGSVLLWVGTTFERRRDDAMRAARRFEQLG